MPAPKIVAQSPTVGLACGKSSTAAREGGVCRHMAINGRPTSRRADGHCSPALTFREAVLSLYLHPFERPIVWPYGPE